MRELAPGGASTQILGAMMPGLTYSAPTSVDDAVKLLAGASGLAKVMSGGTDLLVQLRSGRLRPDLIVDTKKIPGIIGIREENGGFVVGAATPGAVVEAHPGMNKAWPGVVEALDLIGSTQVQWSRSPPRLVAPRSPKTSSSWSSSSRRVRRGQATPISASSRARKWTLRW